MRIPKVYGQSREDSCFFCGSRALAENVQGLPVCIPHKKAEVGNLKCVCGEYVDVKKGKYGAFFLCMRCGPLNLRKIKEFNEIKDVHEETHAEESYDGESKKHKKNWNPKEEITVRSDDPRYFS
jgi:hypothetical protein